MSLGKQTASHFPAFNSPFDTVIKPDTLPGSCWGPEKCLELTNPVGIGSAKNSFS